MSVIDNELLLDRLRWRYATKQFDSSRKIPADAWHTLEETLVLTPSSFGLQPWAFVVVTDPAVREKLKVESRGQSQISDSSHFVVFAARTSLDERYVERHVNRIADVRGLPREGLTEQRDRLVNLLVKGPRSSTVKEWATRQAYIALGNFLTSAVLLGIDTCALEGINAPKFDEILGLSKRGWPPSLPGLLVTVLPRTRTPNSRKSALNRTMLS